MNSPLALYARPLKWIATALMATCSIAAMAQSTYPSRPIKLIVPFTPGGGVDGIARSIGDRLSSRLGQPFVIENRPGAGTIIGNNLVAKAAPDGYTLLMGSSSFTTGPSLAKSLPYSIDTDFAPVALVAISPAVLMVNPKIEVSSVAQLVAKAKSKPGELTSATYGAGSTPHLVSELFQQLTDTKFLSVPYPGGNPAMLSTLSGETNMVFPALYLPYPTFARASLFPSPCRRPSVRPCYRRSKLFRNRAYLWSPAPGLVCLHLRGHRHPSCSDSMRKFWHWDRTQRS